MWLESSFGHNVAECLRLIWKGWELWCRVVHLWCLLGTVRSRNLYNALLWKVYWSVTLGGPSSIHLAAALFSLEGVRLLERCLVRRVTRCSIWNQLCEFYSVYKVSPVPRGRRNHSQERHSKSSWQWYWQGIQVHLLEYVWNPIKTVCKHFWIGSLPAVVLERDSFLQCFISND